MTREEHLAAIRVADAAYYNDDAPVMTDSEYDRLRAEYIEAIRGNLKAQLDNIDIANPDGTVENLGEKYAKKVKN